MTPPGGVSTSPHWDALQERVVAPPPHPGVPSGFHRHRLRARIASMATSAAGGAIRLWARSELGRRWKALVALGVIAGLAGGLALAAVAGARRTSTAYGRW